MYYITLDLEWNQAYAQKALAVQRRLACRLRGEVIQIGAVKLNENMQPCGSYSIIVKPQHFKKLHKHVSELTGITQEQLDYGVSFPEAEESFRRWCGKDFIFLTWGPDDIPMFKENFHIHGIDSKWLDKVYDLQLIFNQQTDGSSKQRSLEYAMEYFEIPQRLPAHDALNDSFFTALVAAKLDVKLGIASYKTEDSEHLESSVIGDADAGDDGYVTIAEMLEDAQVSSPACPICGAALTRTEKPLHTKGQRYSYLYRCQNDGDLILSLKLHRNFNDTWRAKRTIDIADKEKIASFKEALAKGNARRRSAKRLSGGRAKRVAKEKESVNV